MPPHPRHSALSSKLLPSITRSLRPRQASPAPFFSHGEVNIPSHFAIAPVAHHFATSPTAGHLRIPVLSTRPCSTKPLFPLSSIRKAALHTTTPTPTLQDTPTESAQAIPSIHPGGPPAPTTAPTRSIALITASTRPERIGPYLTSYIASIMQPTLPSSITLTTLDIAALRQPLPLLDEAGLAAQRPKQDPTPHYEHSHTRAWSAEVRKHDAFIFVTPQYNWGYPASLKNALDFLYHEWTDKPAMIVSYGARGGVQAAEQLASVLKGFRMRVLEGMVGISISVPENERVRREGGFPEERREKWKEAGVEEGLREGVRGVVKLLEG